VDAKNPTAIDRHVAQRIKLRRDELGLTQEELAERLGVTYQQVQKYERGASRISAGRLFDLAAALKTVIPYFYAGLRLEAAGLPGSVLNGLAEEAEPFRHDDGPASRDRLIEAFDAIPDEDVRRSIIDIAETAAASPARRRDE
jgi:transcriptional regulator with XRE-family HTH domain